MVYFFAGQERRGDIKFWVDELCGRQDLVAEVTEVDIFETLLATTWTAGSPAALAATASWLPHCGGNPTLLQTLPGQMGQQLGASSIKIRILPQRLPLACECTKEENRLV